MIVENLLTDNVYTFELQEELVRNSECDGWKEIPVKVDALTKLTGSDEQITDDHKQKDEVSDAKVATDAAAADDDDDVVDPPQAHQSDSQLSGKYY